MSFESRASTASASQKSLNRQQPGVSHSQGTDSMVSMDDMDRILSPSEDSSFFRGADSVEMACSSTDSIIRRVEEEIANAKKASLLAKNRKVGLEPSASIVQGSSTVSAA